jgi:hypothetical protein
MKAENWFQLRIVGVTRKSPVLGPGFLISPAVQGRAQPSAPFLSVGRGIDTPFLT